MEIINRGKDALQHAIDMKSDYAEAMAYLNLLWRQQALVDALTDPVKAQADVATANAIRDKTIQILNARKAAGAKSMMRELGGVFGIAIAVAVFAGAGSYASPAGFTDGFSPAMGVAAALALVGVIAGLALPGRRRSVTVAAVPAFQAQG